ncbi:MAG: lysophospholipid acyltransferase family protein [Proteobacteria bacterium]|nr:lysophospholipid acyltransferase family protein [Pseudomonadota bacterium]MBU1739161.1 lysophospholipid acyltransferase family protein [Pseudomonadota bacterium]
MIVGKKERNLKGRLESLGHDCFYLTLKLFGHRGGYLLLLPVIFVYVICSGKIHRVTSPYVSRRFPEHGWLRKRVDTFRIVLSFGQVLVDRGWLGLNVGASFSGELDGRDRLLELVAAGKGLILLTAHVGNWQTALSRICDLGAPVNSLMHYEHEAVAKHYFDLRKEPVPFTIINSEGFMGGLVESTAALQRGEIVTIMGDRYTGGPYAETKFLGDTVRLPAAAYSLAGATGSPVAVLLAAKTGSRSYRLKVWNVFQPLPTERNERRKGLSRWASMFAGSVEKYLEEYPWQWYNFYDFWSQ